jgi:hypothetical protein
MSGRFMTPKQTPAPARARLTAVASPVLAIVLALTGGSAQAQQPGRPAQPAARPAAAPGAPAAPGQEGAGAPAAEAPKVKVERGAGGKKVYRITEEIRIEGKIQKPEAFYVLQKSSIDYDWDELRQDFVPKIVDSVSRAPF